MKYGKSTTTNVAISPQFLTKMANDSDLALNLSSHPNTAAIISGYPTGWRIKMPDMPNFG